MINLLNTKNNMKKISIILASLAGLLMLTTACNDEWKEEQYEHYISFKAPLNDDGVSAIYVPYTRKTADGQGQEGVSSYQLPVIVSGTTTDFSDITINIGKSDTLAILNYEQFQNRTDLYYNELPENFATYPATHTIKSGEDVSLYKIDFNFKGIDMSQKWVLPLEIKSGNGYAAHPRKHYAKALLRVYPFNDYSGKYSATTQKMSRTGEDDKASGGETTRAYVVDDKTVFFYAGNDIDESREDRHLYKIYAEFIPDPAEDGKAGTVRFYDPTNNPSLGFSSSDAIFSINEVADEIQPYIIHRYITISGIDYYFNDYTHDENGVRDYHVQGAVTMERKINTQIPDEDMAIEW